MIKEQKIDEFLEALSSRQPVPGGGGASALSGALASALGLMVGNLTVGKKKYADVEEEVQGMMRRLEQLQKDMASLADRDAKVFAPLAAAYGLPSGTEEERAHKEQVMEKNLLAASLVPMEIMEKAYEMLELLAGLEQKGSVMAVSDVGVAVQFARTALTGAVMNVYINTKSMKNRDKAEELNRKADRLMESGTKRADTIYDKVKKRLRKV
ncbi:MAG: cyclodeaminase/cyclohydrolase family protein [Hungatella sp.]|nr:cyclodeaminase/cyclohydrolase family protein [Hungatella sp.]